MTHSTPSTQAPRETGRSPSVEAAHASARGIASNSVTCQDQATLLARALAGDHDAFAQLYSIHRKKVYSLCLRMVGNVAEAEE